MKDKEFIIKQKLCDIYYDPGAGFQQFHVHDRLEHRQ